LSRSLLNPSFSSLPPPPLLFPTFNWDPVRAVGCTVKREVAACCSCDNIENCGVGFVLLLLSMGSGGLLLEGEICGEVFKFIF